MPTKRQSLYLFLLIFALCQSSHSIYFESYRIATKHSQLSLNAADVYCYFWFENENEKQKQKKRKRNKKFKSMQFHFEIVKWRAYTHTSFQRKWVMMVISHLQQIFDFLINLKQKSVLSFVILHASNEEWMNEWLYFVAFWGEENAIHATH